MTTTTADSKIPTDAEYLAKAESNAETWVNVWVRPEYRKWALQHYMRGARVLARHFLKRRKELKKGCSAAEAHALALEERNCFRSRSDFHRIRDLVGAGVTLLKAIDMVEPLRALDEGIAHAKNDLEMAAEQLEPLQEQVEEWQTRIEDMYADLQVLSRDQETAWEELAAKHIAVPALA